MIPRAASPAAGSDDGRSPVSWSSPPPWITALIDVGMALTALEVMDLALAAAEQS